MFEPTEYELERQKKADEIAALGFDPYASVNWPINKINEVRMLHKPNEESTVAYSVAGRVILRRMMGKLCFLTISLDGENIQIGISKNRMKPNSWPLVERIDLGDWVVATGLLGSTKTGEITIWANNITITSKAITPPPSKLEGLKDVELRQRNRHVDLLNENVMETMKSRSKLISGIRHFMESKGFLEVETPILQSLAGGASAKPFKTHHEALNQDMFLRIATELYLKRCLIGGMSKVFEIGKNFRNEGISTKHNPEFTAIEGYEAFSNYHEIMDLVEELVKSLENFIKNIPTVKRIEWQGIGADCKQVEVCHSLNIHNPWRRVSLAELLQEHMERTTMVPNDIMHCYETCIEPELIEPTFVTGMPHRLYPLAKKGKEQSGWQYHEAEMFELVIGGQEVGCGYSEQNNPNSQLEAFQQQGTEIDVNFLSAMRTGMPPAGGFGIGLDRLIALLLNQPSIRDVILFPTMRKI